jgi:hypothetical protein
VRTGEGRKLPTAKPPSHEAQRVTPDACGLVVAGSSQRLKAKIKPVGAKDDRTGKANKEHKKDDTAPGAKTATTKAKIFLKPTVHALEEKEFQQARETTRSLVELIHRQLLCRGKQVNR